jgi:hypothetical protein
MLMPTNPTLRQELSEWVKTSLDVFLAPAKLEATPEAVEQFTQILEAHAKELAKQAREASSALDARAVVSEIRQRRCTRIGATGCRSLSLGMWCDACLLTAALGLIEQQQEALLKLWILTLCGNCGVRYLRCPLCREGIRPVPHHEWPQTVPGGDCAHEIVPCASTCVMFSTLAGASPVATEGDSK